MRMKSAVLAAACWAALSTAAQAQTPDPRDAEIDALKAQVKALTRRLDALEAKAATPPIATLPDPAKSVASDASIVAGKPSIQSADGRFSANLHAIMQLDAASYFQTEPGAPATNFARGGAPADTAHARALASGTDFRRARIGMDGKVFGDWDYSAVFEFGGTGAEDTGHVQDLWLQYSGLRPFHLRIGSFKPSYGLEDQTAATSLAFLERPAVVDIARSISAGGAREGAEVWAAGDRWFASGAVTSRSVGTINSAGSASAPAFDQALGFVGRAVYVPFKGDDWRVHMGAHGSYAARITDTGGPDAPTGAVRFGLDLRERPELRVDGTRLIDTGQIDARHASAAGLELAGQIRNLLVQGEYERIGIERRNSALNSPIFSGWYVEGSWVLTGEPRRYNPATFAFDAPPVEHPFSLAEGTWGAWELAARYSEVDLNDRAGAPGTAAAPDAVRGGDQTILTGGLNWYPNAIVRFLLDYQDVRIDRLSPSALAFGTPAGAQIGQHYRTVALRSQFAF